MPEKSPKNVHAGEAQFKRGLSEYPLFWVGAGLAVAAIAAFLYIYSRSGPQNSAGSASSARKKSQSYVGVFRGGSLWVEDVNGDHQFSAPPDRAFPYGGLPGDIPVTGDWSGDGRTKVGVYRSSSATFILDYDGDGKVSPADKIYNLGIGSDKSDIPVIGDWNGDGRAKIGLFRQGFLWILDTNGNGVFEKGMDKTYTYGGIAGDLPVVGDWNGDRHTKIGVFRQGFLWILDSNGNGMMDISKQPGGDEAFPFGGLKGDIPVVGDWNGDGKSKVGVVGSNYAWRLDANGNHKVDGTISFFFGGIAGDKPVVGHW